MAKRFIICITPIKTFDLYFADKVDRKLWRHVLIDGVAYMAINRPVEWNTSANAACISIPYKNGYKQTNNNQWSRKGGERFRLFDMSYKGHHEYYGRDLEVYLL